jgi:hypothetical protein
MRSYIKGLEGKDGFLTLPTEGRSEPAPEWPLEDSTDAELAYWELLWAKPQAYMWEIIGLEFSVAMYVRTYLEAAAPGAVNGLKTAALRMEGELGISLPGMKSLGWQIAPADTAPAEAMPPAARKTSSGDWLKAVSVEGA